MNDLTIKLESNPNLSVTWKSTLEFKKSDHYYQEVDIKLSYTTLKFYISLENFYHNDEMFDRQWSLYCSPETHRELWGQPIENYDQEILDHGKPFENYGQIQGWLVNWAYSCEEGHYTDANYDPEVA